MLQKLSIERVVVILTPLFAAGATWLVALVGSNVPGAPHLDAGAIEGVEIASFISVCGVVAKWLHGRQIPAIAQLSTSPAEVVAINAAAQQWLVEHAHELQGPPGPAGATPTDLATPEEVQAFVHGEIARMLQVGAAAPPVTQ